MLLAGGANIEVVNKDRWTPLHLACYHDKLAKNMIARGANIKATTNDGVTPLHNACYSGHVGVAKRLH